jgi:hypothetical protein
MKPESPFTELNTVTVFGIPLSKLQSILDKVKEHKPEWLEEETKQ